jgi:hypothetical protein
MVGSLFFIFESKLDEKRNQNHASLTNCAAKEK